MFFFFGEHHNHRHDAILYGTLDKIAHHRLELKEISVMVPGAVPQHVRQGTLDDSAVSYLMRPWENNAV